MLLYCLNMKKKLYRFLKTVPVLLVLTINQMVCIWTAMEIKPWFINTIEKVIKSWLKSKGNFLERPVTGKKKTNPTTILNS